jgi:hypothetical protein
MKKETMLKAFTDISDDFILEAAPQGSLPKEKKAFGWFNARVLAGAFAVFLMAFLLPRVLRPAQQGTPGTPDVAIARPYTVCETMQEAEALAGFALECPEEYQELRLSEIAVYQNSLIDAAYCDASDEVRMHIRKAEGSDDISGDYNTWETETKIQAAGKTVTLKGDEGLYRLLIWTENGYSYAVSLSEGILPEEAAALAEAVH